MKKIYKVPGMMIVKIQPTMMIAQSSLSLTGGHAIDSGIKTADGRNTVWDDEEEEWDNFEYK